MTDTKEMRVIALSRKEIESMEFTNHTSVAICIAYPSGRLHKVLPQDELKDVLHLRFSDCDAEKTWSFPANKDEANDPMPMTRGNAVDILDFVYKWKDKVDTIYCACYGGISRSSGVLAGLCAVYSWDDSGLYKTKIPNAHCKFMIMKEGIGD